MESWPWSVRSLVLLLLLIAIFTHQADCIRFQAMKMNQLCDTSGKTEMVPRIYVTDDSHEVNNLKWREELADASRQKILCRLAETLHRAMPDPGRDQRFQIARQFEAETFQSATDRGDYRRKIALKILDLEIQADQVVHDDSEWKRKAFESEPGCMDILHSRN